MARSLLFLCIALFASARPLVGATFNIADGDVAGLLDALYQSDHNLQNDTINLAANGTYVLTAASSYAADSGHSAGPSGLFFSGDYDFDQDRSYDLTINGNNATITRSSAAGTPNFRLMEIRNAVAGSLTCHADINNVIFANGNSGSTFQEYGYGGGLFIEGDVTLNNCTIRNNSAYRGGGLFATLHVVLTNCTIMQNTASDIGGGIQTQAQNFVGTLVSHDSSLSLTNCTVAENGAAGDGAGIYRFSPAMVSLVGCTLARNGIYSNAAPTSTGVSFQNTLFSDSPAEFGSNGDGGASVVSNGYNLTNATTQGCFTQATDRWNANPKLDRRGLQMNGGPTPTIALCAGSDAIDHGSSGIFDFFDQRGSSRRVDNPSVANTDDGTDIGAYEAPVDPIQYGQPFAVTTLADHDDGVCSGNDCTLREAISRTNASPGETISLPASLSGTLTLNGSELVVTSTVQITGPGARALAISAQTQSRVFSFIGSINCSLSGLAIREGFVSGPSGSSNVGGGIYNEGILTLSDCAIVHNRVLGGSGITDSGQDGGTARGGGIFNGGTLTLNRCTIGGANSNSANGATGGTGADHPTDGEITYNGGKGGAGLGGAIFNDTNGTLGINNCTIAGNTAAGGAGGAANRGGAGGEGTGGIYNSKTIMVTASTISTNSGNGGPGGHSSGFGANGTAGRGIGGIHSSAGAATVRSTIIAANTQTQSGGIDVEGGFTSSGFNLIGTSTGSTGFTAVTDMTGTNAALLNPLLGPIQNNGGPTDTMALLDGSPALDKGFAFSNNIDQRSQTRPRDNPGIPNATGGDGSDIGAFEADTNLVGPSPTPTATATSTPTATPAPIPTATPTATFTPAATATPAPTATPTAAPTATATASPSPSPTPLSHLLNIATRLRVQTGDNVLIGGFIITGSDPKRLVIRGIGPSLAQFFSDPLPDPTLELYQGDTVLATNNDWKESQAEVEATGLQPSNDLESAIVRTLVPGNYTAIVRGNGNSTGIGVVEAYDLSPSSNSKLANIATRGFVATGDNVMIGGFITGGDAQIVIRAIGPSLGNFGVSGALPDPTLDLVNANGDVIRSNNDWKESQQNEIAATGLQPGDDRESALIESLPPGNYTAIIRGVANSTGIGLVEIYDYH
jgi:CSLREA domain-containing protein